jgi:Tol biopolymer transport system component
MAVLLAHLSNPPPMLSTRRPDLAGAADQVLARGMAKVPDKRFGTCREFADALRAALALGPYELRDSVEVIVPTAAGADKAPVLDLADLATADTVDSASSERSDAAAVPTGPATGAAGAEQQTPAGTDGPGPGSGSGALPLTGRPRRPITRATGWIRRYRFLAAVLTSAVLVAAGVVPFVLTRSPGPKGASSARSGSATARRSQPADILGYARIGTLADLTDTEGVWSVAFNRSGTTLAAPGGTGVDLWNITSKKLAGTLDDPDGVSPDSVAFGPSGTVLATTSGSNTKIYLWDVTTKKVAATLTAPAPEYSYSALFSPDGRTLAVFDSTGGGGNARSDVHLWNIATSKRTATLVDPADSDGISAAAFSPDGRTFAAVGGNGDLYLWNVSTRKRTEPFNKSGISSVAFNPRGTTLAAADGDGHTYLWDLVTKKQTATFTNPDSNGISSIAFSPDGAVLASADFYRGDGTILWNIATRKRIATLIDPASQGVVAVAFSPDGKTIATGDYNGNIYLWRKS